MFPLILITFFTVNDSIIQFRNKTQFKVSSSSLDTIHTIIYYGSVEDYETGTYYYPKSLIKEIRIQRKKQKTTVKVILTHKRKATLSQQRIIFTIPETPFFLKINAASREDIKTLLKSVGIKYNWLDSLADKDYTICGKFTEKTLKEILLKHGK